MTQLAHPVRPSYVRAGRAEVLESAMWNLIKAVPQFAEASVAVKGSYGQGLGEEM